VIALVVGTIAMIAACVGIFFSVLAVGVSDGAGHVTAQIMLTACILAALVASVVIACSENSISKRR